MSFVLEDAETHPLLFCIFVNQLENYETKNYRMLFGLVRLS